MLFPPRTTTREGDARRREKTTREAVQSGDESKRRLPSIRGWLALESALALGLLLPALTSARENGRLVHPVDTLGWLSATLGVVICVIVCVIAARHRLAADRIAAAIAGAFVVWMVYAFFDFAL